MESPNHPITQTMLNKIAAKLENTPKIAIVSIIMRPPNFTLLNLSIYWHTGTISNIKKRDLYLQD
jgi:hypothetical protein